jgi:Ca2+-binding EF-hand superfamily protein
MKLEFKLYDSQRDGVISVDELYDMQTSLPPDSPACHECSR